MDNLSKLYLTEVIRRECWDDMLVKGRGLVVSESFVSLDQHCCVTTGSQEPTCWVRYNFLSRQLVDEGRTRHSELIPAWRLEAHLSMQNCVPIFHFEEGASC